MDNGQEEQEQEQQLPHDDPHDDPHDHLLFHTVAIDADGGADGVGVVGLALLPFQEKEVLEMDALENRCSGSVVTTFGWLANPSGCGKNVTMASYLNERGALRVPYSEKTFVTCRTAGRNTQTHLLVQQTQTYGIPFNAGGLPETPSTLWVCSSIELDRVRTSLRLFAPDIRFTVLKRLNDIKRLASPSNVTAASFHEDHIVDFIERRGISVVVVLDSFLSNYRRVFQRLAWNRIVVSNIFRNKTILGAFAGDDFVRRFFWVLQSVPEAMCGQYVLNTISRVALPNVRLGVFDTLQKSGTLWSVMIRTINLQLLGELQVEFERVEIPTAVVADEEMCVQQRADKILHDLSFSNLGGTYRYATKRAWLIDEARRSLDFLNIRGMQTVDDLQAFLIADVEACIAQASPPDLQAFQGKLTRLQRTSTEPLECPVCLTTTTTTTTTEPTEAAGGAEGGSEGAEEGGGGIGKKFVTIRSCHHKLCSTCCAILVSRTSPTVCPSCRQDFNAMHVLVPTEDVEAEANAIEALRQAEIASYGLLESRQDRIVRAVRTVLEQNPAANVIVTVESVEQTRHNLLYDLSFTDEELERVWTIGLCDTSFLLDANVSAPPGVNLCDVTHVVSCFPIADMSTFERTLSDFCMGYRKTVHVIEIL
jgi:hypothetical protein